MTKVQSATLVWLAVVTATVVVDIIIPQPFGPSALGAIFEPYLVLTGVVAGIVSLRSPGPEARALLLALIAIALPRYVPAFVSFPPEPGAHELSVSTWNIEAGEDAADRALLGISGSKAQLIAIEELQPDVAAALMGATDFEFFALPPASIALDLGLLSRHPIVESQMSTDPPFLRAVVDPLEADPIVVYVVHPPLGRYITLGDVPVAVDLSVRDAAIALIRIHVEQDLARERSVIVLGDMNTTEREPAYAQLATGLRDAHLDAGMGPGFTWRPGPLSFLPFGMLRIDYVFSTPDLIPTSSTVDCSLPSDHCRVDAILTMTRTTRGP